MLRLERDRKGVLRVFPGANLQRPVSPVEPAGSSEAGEISPQPEAPVSEAPEFGLQADAEPAAEEPDVATTVVIDVTPEAQPQEAGESEEEAPARRARSRRPRQKAAPGKVTARKPAGVRAAAPRKRRDQI